ncbi:hypothetical protein GN958_ATG21961 [Phytophthora infestans]|uniref:Uncharacterized protein n=1 Tax=Phytophthora infestans TaxID=4787 RepID=A0A8S9TQL3_PHYIN|nr:hypothetical protein GN958_ATG21961 [Phytophthora infestans]
MLKEETPQDAAYSDDEFGSERAYHGGDEFVDEDKVLGTVKQSDDYDGKVVDDAGRMDGSEADGTQADPSSTEAGKIIQEETYDGELEFDEDDHPPACVDADKEQEDVKQDSLVRDNTEETEQYDDEFDGDDRTEVGTGSQTLESDGTATEAEILTQTPQEDGEAFDREFEEYDHPPVATDSTPVETGETLVEYTPSEAKVSSDDEAYDREFDSENPAMVAPDAAPPTVDNCKTTMLPDNIYTSGVLVDTDNILSHDRNESEDSEAEYLNDVENDAIADLPSSTGSLSRNSIEDNSTQHRSATPVIAQLTADTPTTPDFDRTPIVLSVGTPEVTDAACNQEVNDSYSDDRDSHVTDKEVSPEEGKSSPDSAKLPTSAPTSESTPTNDDDYTEEMEDEFAITPQLNEEDKPSDEGCDYGVDKLKEDSQRETDILLQENLSLLSLQHNVTGISKLDVDVESPDYVAQFGNDENETPGEADDVVVLYDDFDEFADDNVDAHVLKQETLQQGADADEIGQYDNDEEEFEDHEVTAQPPGLQSDEIGNPEEATSTDTDSAHLQRVLAIEDTVSDTLSKGATMPIIKDAQPPESLQQDDLPSASTAVKQDEKATSAKVHPKKSPRKLSQQENKNVAGLKQPVKNGEPSTKQPSPPMKPSRPSTKKSTPTSSVLPNTPTTDIKSTSTSRASHSKLKTATSTLIPPFSVGSETKHKTATLNPQPESPPKNKQKNSSLSTPSPDPSHNALKLFQKEPLPKQKVNPKPSTSGDHSTKRRMLQPVRTPANLHFNLPKMDKAKRDWLFATMFRHGDDLRKYEAFVPPVLLAKPPTTKETKKRPLSARQVSGTPYSSRFESSGRKLVPQPNPELQNRERNWVATTPHDSKLPQYDSILDKYCTRVTNPEVQRQIYQTRQRDLSPQLAFVLEKRVAKHYRKGFYDSFGGVGSYKTEIVPTAPGDGMRPRQMSPSSSTKSGLLERQALSRVALDEK